MKITYACEILYSFYYFLIEIIDKQCSSFFQRLSMIDERNFPFMLQCLVSWRESLFDWIRHLYVISVYDHVEIVVIMHICKITYNNGSVIMEQWSKTRHRFISAMLLQKCYKRWCIRSFFNDLRSKNTSRLLYNTRRYTGSLLFFFLRFFFPRRK